MQLSDLETLLQTTYSDDQNDAMQARLDAAIDWAKGYCNNEFLDDKGNEAIPKGAQLAIATIVKSMGENSNVASQSLGDMSKSFFEGSTMKAAKKYLLPYRRPKAIQ